MPNPKQRGSRGARSWQAARYRRMYHTANWRRLRILQLTRQPICAMCNEKPAKVVDHKTPHRGNMELFNDLDNLQSLCHNCHSEHKQRDETRGFSGAVDNDGWPTDPQHPANRR